MATIRVAAFAHATWGLAAAYLGSFLAGQISDDFHPHAWPKLHVQVLAAR